MGPTSKGREGSGRERGRVNGKEERGGGLEPPPLQISGYHYATDNAVYSRNVQLLNVIAVDPTSSPRKLFSHVQR